MWVSSNQTVLQQPTAHINKYNKNCMYPFVNCMYCKFPRINDSWFLMITSNGSWCMGIKGEMSGTVCVTFPWYIYIVVYSYCLFCCLFIIVTWWFVWCIVWASGSGWVNSISELELQLNSHSGIGIGIGGIENGIWIENCGIGIENRNWLFCSCYQSNDNEMEWQWQWNI